MTRGTLLVVDDDDTIAEQLVSTLKAHRYAVCGRARRAGEVESMVDALRPTLVLLDAGLRDDGLDAIELSRRLRDRDDVGVVFVTTHAERVTMAQALATNPYGFVLVPVGEAELVSAMEIALSRFALEQRLVALERAARERENLLDRALERLRGVFAALPDAVFEIDRHGVVLEYKPSASAPFAPLGDGMRTIDERLPPVVAGRLRSAILRALADPTSVQTFEYSRGFQGLAMDFEVRVSAASRDTAACIVRNVSERRSVAQAKEEFVAVVSHELRTPLTAIVGGLTLLLNGVAGALPADARDIVQLAKRNGDRLKALVNDILDVHQIETRVLSMRCTDVDLVAALGASLRALGPIADGYGVSFDFLPDDAPAMVRVDERRLVQVLENLLSNAAKFSPRGAAISLAIERRRKWARVSVADRGRGVSESFRPHLFEKFAQEGDPTTRDRSGTGLGLSIAKGLVEQMGGAIGFEPREGGGSVFFVDLPSSEPDAVAEP